MGELLPVDFRPAPDAALALVAQHFGGHLLFANRRYDCRVEIRSQSTADTNYVVARGRRSGEWSCGCKGWVGWHTRKPGFQCKHLKAMQAPLELALELQGLTSQPAPLPVPAGVWQHPESS